MSTGASRMALTLAALLATGLAWAEEPKDVDINLLAGHGDQAVRLTVPRGEDFLVRLVNKAPSALYRVTVDWRLSPETPSRPPDAALHPTYDLGAPFESMMTVLENHPCTPMQERRRDLLQTTDESLMPAKLKAFETAVVPKVCEGMVKNTLEAARPHLRSTYKLMPDDVLNVTLERLDAATKAVQRTWRAEIVPESVKLGWTYPTEEAWIVGETSRDVAEMLLYAKSPTPPDPKGLAFVLDAPTSGPGGASVYQVDLSAGKGPFSFGIRMGEHAWSPKAYADFAAAFAAHLGLKLGSTAGRSGEALQALTDPRSEVLERESQRVSRKLEAAMLDPVAHDQAALILGTFALRESLGVFHDRRWALCRMAAHLAMARALRGSAAQPAESAVAEALLATHAVRSAEALERLAAIEKAGGPAAIGPWVRALRVRSTGDWRMILAQPEKATLLEQLEEHWALEYGVGGPRALEFLQQVHPAPLPDWGRVQLAGDASVEEWNVFGPGAVDAEMNELALVYRTATGRDLPPEEALDAFKEPPGRCVASVGGKAVVRVLGWGAWSQLLQRSLMDALLSEERYYHALGLKEERKQFVEKSPKAFASLPLTTFVTLWWRERNARPGPASGPCEAVAAWVSQSPEVATLSNWQRAADSCSQARDSGTLPPPQRWLGTEPPLGTLLDSSSRLLNSRRRSPRTVEDAEALLRLAPHNRNVLFLYEGVRWPKGAPADEAMRLAGPLAEYDVEEMKHLVSIAKDDVALSRQLFERMVQLDPENYLSFGDYLVKHGLAEEAATAYERAAERARDRVSVANRIEWLVDYDFDHGKKEKALEIAQQAAETYSETGLSIMGRLLERMGRYQEAEGWYKRVEERYQRRTDLLCFYIRSQRRPGGGPYPRQAAAALEELFPSGLEQVTVESLGSPPTQLPSPRDPTAPRHGVYVSSAAYDQMGLKGSDLVVAVDSYRVRSEDQVSCVRSWSQAPRMTFIVMRGRAYVELSGPYERERFDP